MNESPIEAAVLIPLITTSQNLERGPSVNLSELRFSIPQDTFVFLTVRSQHVEHHKGQISFPGGMRDGSDPSLMHTALRETFEETGLAPSRIQIIGNLEPVNTVTSNFLVTPFVGLISNASDVLSGQSLRLSPTEIEKPLFVPLTHLIDPKNMTFETYLRPGIGKMRLPSFHYQGHRIWGATALMLYRFLKRVRQ